MLVQRNLARTKQLARLVLQTEITSVCVLTDLLDMIVNTVGNTLMQPIIKSLRGFRRCGGDAAEMLC